MIKVIVFDAEGTLFNSLPKDEKIRNILKSQGYDRNLEEIGNAFRLSKRIANLLHSNDLIKLDDSGYLLENEIRLMLLGFTDEESVTLARVMNEQWTKASNRTPYPETIDVLEALKNRYRIGLLTAGAILSYSQTLKDMDLEKYFSFIIGEDTINVPKPDPKAYAYVIKKAGCNADEILFIGDNRVNDYEGPIRSGMRAVLVDRENTCKEDIAKINDLTPLLDNKFIARL